MRRLRLIVPVALVLGAAAAGATAQEPPAPGTPPVTTPAPPAAPVPVPRHPATRTGWARTVTAGVPLSAAPDPAAAHVGAAPSTQVAAEVLAVAAGADGGVWVRVRYPGTAAGWAPGTALKAVAPPPALSPAALAQIDRGMTAMGPGAALVVRDQWGRTILTRGTTRALSLASVTKLATMAAALRVRDVPAGTARAILGSSDNRAAQRLSNSLGRGSRAAGARTTQATVATMGARMRLVDGSGLSPANRASAWEVTDLLVAMRDEPRFPTFLRALPVAAKTGTLAGRMHGTSAAGRVRAKTGTLFDHPTSSLCGYVWPAGTGLAINRALITCMLENGVSPHRARPAQDLIAQALTARGALVRR